MANEHIVFLWALPLFGIAFIMFQLHQGRVAVGPWRTVDKSEDEGRFWLFIAAESLLVLILVGQALSATL